MGGTCRSFCSTNRPAAGFLSPRFDKRHMQALIREQKRSMDPRKDAWFQRTTLIGAVARACLIHGRIVALAHGCPTFDDTIRVMRTRRSAPPPALGGWRSVEPLYLFRPQGVQVLSERSGHRHVSVFVQGVFQELATSCKVPNRFIILPPPRPKVKYHCSARPTF